MISSAAVLILLFGVSPAGPAHAVTVAEALAAEAMLGKVDGMSADDRAAFIRDNRAQLNQALMTEQVIGTIRHTVQVAALASLRLYHRPLLCGIIANEDQGDDDQEVGGRPPLPPPAPLSDMVAGPATEARLAQIDIAEIIVNRMISDNKCEGKGMEK
jgi:hypothetical protein